MSDSSLILKVVIVWQERQTSTQITATKFYRYGDRLIEKQQHHGVFVDVYFERPSLSGCVALG